MTDTATNGNAPATPINQIVGYMAERPLTRFTTRDLADALGMSRAAVNGTIGLASRNGGPALRHVHRDRAPGKGAPLHYWYDAGQVREPGPVRSLRQTPTAAPPALSQKKKSGRSPGGLFRVVFEERGRVLLIDDTGRVVRGVLLVAPT